MIYYKIFRYFFITVVLTYTVLTLAAFSVGTGWIKSSNAGGMKFMNFLDNSADFFGRVKNFDPYYDYYVRRKAELADKLENHMIQFYLIFKRFNEDKLFKKKMFYYVIQGENIDLQEIVDEHFKKNPNFRELIVIDQNTNLIYKHKNLPITPEYFEVNQSFVLTNIDPYLTAVFEKKDTVLEYNIHLVGYFDNDEFGNLITEQNDEVFMMIGNHLYHSKDDAVITTDIIQALENRIDIYYIGLQRVEQVPIFFQGRIIGMMAYVFPLTVTWVTFLIAFVKFFLLSLILIGLWFLDRLISAKLYYYLIEKKEKEEHLTEATVEWLDDYVNSTDEEKE